MVTCCVHGRQIAADIGMDRSTTHRFITTLLDIGAVVRDPATRRYRLGLPLLSYAFVLLNMLEVRRIALAYLHELHRDLEATVSLGVRDGAEVVLVERQSLAGPWVPPPPGPAPSMTIQRQRTSSRCRTIVQQCGRLIIIEPGRPARVSHGQAGGQCSSSFSVQP
jgi:hypothetical protein